RPSAARIHAAHHATRKSRRRLQARARVAGAAFLPAGVRLLPGGDRSRSEGQRQERRDAIPLVPRPGADVRAGAIGGRAQDVRAGGEARVLRRRGLLQPRDRISPEPAARPGVRGISSRAGAQAAPPPHPRGDVALRAALQPDLQLPGARPCVERAVRADQGPLAGLPRSLRHQRSLNLAGIAARALARALSVLPVLLVAVIGFAPSGFTGLSYAAPAPAEPESKPGPAGAAAAPGAPPPRETQQLSAETLLARGLLYVARPTPADQAEGQRLLRKALDDDATLAAAHVGLARSAIYLHAAGIDERAEILKAAQTEARAAVEAAPDSASAHAVMALAFALSDRLTPARGEADRAIAADAASFEGHLAQCVVLRLRRDLEAAVEACRQAAARAPDEPRVLM